MHAGSTVFAISFVAQAEVTYVNQIAALAQTSNIVDHSVVLSDSSFVLEAASISKLSAYDVDSSDFISSFDQYLNHEDVYLDDELDAWFIWLDSRQPALTATEIEAAFTQITNEFNLSVFKGSEKAVARFFTAKSFDTDSSFIESDIQWLNLTTKEMYR